MQRNWTTGLIVVLAFSTSAIAQSPTEAEIAQAISQLGDDSFQTREAATRFLWQAGAGSEAALEKAEASNDPEVRIRARALLAKFHLGIYPDTPAEVVEKLQQFREQPNRQQQILSWLASEGHYRTLATLIRREQDAQKRRSWAAIHLRRISTAVAPAIASGDYAQAEALLDLAAINDDNIRHWAAFHVLRDTAEAQEERFKTLLDGELTKEAKQGYALRLTYLLRAKGDLTAACAMARLTGNSDLEVRLLQEAGQWETLSRYQLPADAQNKADDLFGLAADELAAVPSPSPLGQSELERLSYTAAWHRLAGRQAEAAAALKQIESLAEGDKLTQQIPEALLLNDQYDRGLELLKRRRSTTAFKLLVYRQQPGDALMHAGIRQIKGPYPRWFHELAKNARQNLPPDAKRISAWDENVSRFHHALEVARQLHALGEKEDAKTLLDFLEGVAVEGDRRYGDAIPLAKCELGYREEGLAAAAKLLNDQNAPQWFGALYRAPVRPAAEALWTLARAEQPDESTAQSLQRLEQWLGPGWKQISGEEWGALMTRTIKANAKAKARASRLESLAKVSRVRGDEESELKLLKEIAATGGAAQQCAVGEFYLRHEQWEQAAQWFEELGETQAARDDVKRGGESAPFVHSDNPLATYLHGYALTKLDQQAAGEKLMHTAILVPLADGRKRYEFGTALEQLGLKKAARQQWEIIVRTESPSNVYLYNAGAQLAGEIIEENPGRAAQLWIRLMHSTFASNAFFMEPYLYLKLPRIVHFAQGLAKLNDGDADAAVQQFDLAHSASPGDIELPLHVVPLLRKAGRAAAAERIFTKVYEVNRQVCQDFPRSAEHHNRCAWLAARCRMRLDEALVHAEKGVELAPEKAAYLDTLAEVHYAQGDREKAIEIMRRCVKMAPHEEEFRTRLAEFEKNWTKSPNK